MRGQHILFNDLVSPQIEKPKAEGIGRSKTLIARRNERLCYRYYYYIKLLEKHYPATIALLSEQFDLSEDRIITSLSLSSTVLKRIMQTERPTRTQLAEKYPYLVW